MKILIKKWILAIFCLFFGFLGNSQAPTPPGQKTFAFTNVSVIPMDREEVLDNHTVIISEGRIAALEPAAEAEIPSEAEVIDGNGKYLIPGLTEMHGHIPGKDQPQYAEDVLFLYLANGVTTVRNMLGHPYHLELRERVKNNEFPGPTIYAAGPFFNREQIPDPESAEKAVREQKAAGFDLLKMGSIDKQTYARMAKTAKEVNIPFAGHVPEEVGLTGALEAGQKSIDHYDRYVEFLVPEEANLNGRKGGFFGSGIIDLIDRNRLSEAVDKTVQSGTWNVPTLSLVEHLASPEPAEEIIKRPEMKYMPGKVLEDWVKAKKNFKERDDFQPEATEALVDFRRELTLALHDAGAPIALGSDAPQFFNVPGFSLHREMEMMATAGLTPYEVLVTGTRNPAIYFEAEEEFGTIQSGKRADLILLEANPLEDIKNTQKIKGVMVRGKWFSEMKIKEKLEEIENR